MLGVGEPHRITGDDRVGTATSSPAEPRRLGVIDALRGITATVIAIHHICSYGPLPDRVADFLPQTIDWIWAYGRMAVQGFLVIGGFMAALTLGRTPIGPLGFPRFVVRRYVRLGFPYLAALLYVLALWVLIPEGLAAFPLFDELNWRLALSHVVFLQGILGYPSLSAGLWYLAIDFQFGLFFYLLMIVHQGSVRALRVRSKRLDTALLLALSMPWALMSVYVWNRIPDNDLWVFYYLGPLFLGVMCGWALAGRIPRGVFWAYAGALVVGLVINWRMRLAVALVTGVLIYGLGRRGKLHAGVIPPLLQSLGRISYSLFLVHYPTTWAVESLGARLWDQSPGAALVGMVVAFVVTLVAAVVMYRFVEQPCLRLSDRLRPRNRAVPIAVVPPGNLDDAQPIPRAEIFPRPALGMDGGL